jgi:hypothetical protein
VDGFGFSEKRKATDWKEVVFFFLLNLKSKVVYLILAQTLKE